MKVCILQSDIDAGERGDDVKCAGVLAVKRATGAYHVKINGQYCFVQYKRGQLSEKYSVSENFYRWMRRYDEGFAVKPANFEFEFLDNGVKMDRTPKVPA